MDSIELLKNKLNSLPSEHEKLQSWNKIIKNLDLKEREILEISINLLSNSDISANELEMNLIAFESEVGLYQNLFNSLIERMSISINELKNKLKILNKNDFIIKINQFRKDENERCINKAKNQAKLYFNSFRVGVSNKYQYIRDCESMVTPVFFQPDIYPCNDREEREIFYNAFKGFNPESYCKIFRTELSALFKQIE